MKSRNLQNLSKDKDARGGGSCAEGRPASKESRCTHVENAKVMDFQVRRSLSSSWDLTTFWLSYLEEVFISLLKVKWGDRKLFLKYAVTAQAVSPSQEGAINQQQCVEWSKLQLWNQQTVLKQETAIFRRYHHSQGHHTSLRPVSLMCQVEITKLPSLYGHYED